MAHLFRERGDNVFLLDILRLKCFYKIKQKEFKLQEDRHFCSLPVLSWIHISPGYIQHQK